MVGATSVVSLQATLYGGSLLVDLCRKMYDVALMNPPFGEPAMATRSYVAAEYAESKEDIYAAFVARFVSKLNDRGLLGIISNRTGFFLTGMRRWRESVLLGTPAVSALADLGDGVLDDALVEAAAYVITRTDVPCAFFRMLDQKEKSQPLYDAIMQFGQGRLSRRAFVRPVAVFRDFPEARIAYWASESIRTIYRTLFRCRWC